MNVKKYIESGILEDYVLGLVSDLERKEVESLSKIYPEISDYLLEIENIMAGVSVQFKQDPPAELTAEILKHLDKQEELFELDGFNELKEEEEAQEGLSEKDSGFKLPKLPKIRLRMIHGLIAAIVSTILFAYLYLDVKSQVAAFANTANEALAETDKIENISQEKENEIAGLKGRIEILEKDLGFYRNPNLEKITLEGRDKFEGQMAIIYWDRQTKKAWLQRNTLSLPADTAQVLHLWARYKGVGQDLGFIGNSGKDELSPLPDIVNADEIWITIDPKKRVLRAPYYKYLVSKSRI